MVNQATERPAGCSNPYAADDGMDNIEAAERPDAMSVIEQPDGQMRWAEV